MNQEVKEKWLAALRSGDYVQGTGTMRRIPDDGPDRFCCLGVLCEVAITEGVAVRREQVVGRYAYDGRVGFLPDSVRDWAGLDEDSVRIPSAAVSDIFPLSATDVNISGVNDRGVPFEDIANLLEIYA